MSILKIDNLNFSFKNKKIFQDFSLEMTSGINYITGENGSGKSTLIKILATVLVPKSGHIYLDEVSYENLNKIKSDIAYIPQEFDVYPNLKTEELIELVCLCKGMKPDRKKIDEVTELLNLGEYKNVKMKELSVGTKKRVAIAQAIVTSPKLLLADEPTAGLDEKNRKAFNDNLRNILSKFTDTVVVYSTHISDDIRDEKRIAVRL